MTPRFTVVSAPIEGRVGEGIAHAAHEVMAMGARLKVNVNETLHDEHRRARAVEKVSKIVVPTGLPFVLLCIFVALYAVRELLVRIETKRIMRQHASGSVPAEAREHRD
jgi:hypothetical protein